VDEAFISILVGVAALVVYLRTMCRTIYVGDSGELAAAVHVWGVPHPPGYPLYVLLGKLFSLLVPVGKPALRLSIFSAVCASAAVAFLYLSLIALGFATWTSAGVALAWAFSASLWSQSGIQRVYALGALISSAATYCAIRWYFDPEQLGWLIASAAIVALGVANHTVVAIHVLAIAALVVMRRPQILREPRLWIGFAIAAIPPALLYFVWIPLRARARPPVNWGNIRSFRELRDFLARKQYWRHRYVRSARQLVEVVAYYLRRIVVEYGWLGAAAIVVGIVPLWMHAPEVATMLGLLLALNALSMIVHARREDIFHWTRYMIAGWFALGFPLAFGWDWMLRAFPAPARPCFAFLPAIVLLVTQFRKQDVSRHRYADEYNRRMLASLPENATLIAQDDNVVFPLMYLKYGENVRPDVKLLEQGVHQLQQLKFNPRKEAVYCTHWQAAFNVPATPTGPGLRLVPEGLIYRIVSTDMSYGPRDLWNPSDNGHLLPAMEDANIPRNYLTRCLLGNVYFMRAEWEQPRDVRSAMAWYQRAARMAYDSAVQHYNLGLVYERMGCAELSRDEFEIAARIAPHYSRTERADLRSRG
jgi:hypothetical protein